MKRLFLLIVALLLLAFGITFAMHNTEPAQLNYYFGSIQAPIALIVVLALAAGAILGVLASVFMLMAQRHRLGRLQRKLEMCEQEIRNLRQIPLQDKH